jgi:SWI/SNF-related matrix-associated actin-dependent regulator of chromatin subfamily A3
MQKPKDAPCDYCKLPLSQNTFVDEIFRSHFTVCGHLLCSKCLPQFEHAVAIAKDELGLRCPLCEVPINGDHLQQGSPIIADELNEDGVSSKVTGLLADLVKNAGKGKRYAKSCAIEPR